MTAFGVDGAKVIVPLPALMTGLVPVRTRLSMVRFIGALVVVMVFPLLLRMLPLPVRSIVTPPGALTLELRVTLPEFVRDIELPAVAVKLVTFPVLLIDMLPLAAEAVILVAFVITGPTLPPVDVSDTVGPLYVPVILAALLTEVVPELEFTFTEPVPVTEPTDAEPAFTPNELVPVAIVAAVEVKLPVVWKLRL
jgi:hypothetical protein